MKMPRLRLVKSLSQKAFLLTATSLFILLVNFSPLQAEGDYTFRDQNYEEISLPRKPVIRFKQPGALFKEAAFHRPKIEVKSRREGLETVRILTFNFEKQKSSDPLSEDKLTAIYLLDKDLLVVGYQKIPAGGGPVTILINSVINYLRVYIECTQHGLWLEELAIPR